MSSGPLAPGGGAGTKVVLGRLTEAAGAGEEVLAPAASDKNRIPSEDENRITTRDAHSNMFDRREMFMEVT
jgi:hypothetical protein